MDEVALVNGWKSTEIFVTTITNNTTHLLFSCQSADRTYNAFYRYVYIHIYGGCWFALCVALE